MIVTLTLRKLSHDSPSPTSNEKPTRRTSVICPSSSMATLSTEGPPNLIWGAGGSGDDGKQMTQRRR